MNMIKIIQSRANVNGVSLIKFNNTLTSCIQPNMKFILINNIDKNLYRLKASHLDSIFYKKNEFLASDDIELAFNQLCQLSASQENCASPCSVVVIDDVNSKWAFMFKRDLLLQS